MFPYHVMQNVSLPRVHCTGESETDAIQRTTTAITMIQGGIKENVMPSIARVSQLWENRERENKSNSKGAKMSSDFRETTASTQKF